MTHRNIVQVGLLVWLICLTRLAGAATYTQEFLTGDYASLATAAFTGLMGGVLRTIFTLANDNRVVFAVLKDSRWNFVLSLIAGGACYLILAAVESRWQGTVTREIRFVSILAAGWFGRQFFDAIARLARAKIDGKAHEFRAGAESTEPPVSAIVPLEKR